MKALLRWLGVDPVQWRALVVASLKIDLLAVQTSTHSTMAPGSKPPKRSLSGGIWLSILIYGLAGLSPAMAAALATDTLFAATLMVTVLSFMVLSSLLIGEGTTILSPSDHHVLGFRPVTSRTYLAVRVATLLVRTFVITTCVALAPVLVFLLKGGLNPPRAIGALVAAYGAGLAVTLALVATYGWVLRLAGPARVMRWASYTQFAAQMLVWVGIVFVSNQLGKQVMTGVTITERPWALLFPGTWFAAYVPLFEGQIGWLTIIPAVLAIGLVVALGRAIGGKLSLEYAESLGRLTSAAAPQARDRAETRWLQLLDSETRAVAILVRSHMQHDIKFRLGVISLIPITFMYMYMGGLPHDPFVPGAKPSGDAPVIQMMLLFLPITLRRVLVASDKFRASWVFHSTPADHGKLVLSSRNIITLFFLVPYLLFLTAIFIYSFGDWAHAFLHTVFTGFISYLVLQFIILVNPQLPFSQPLDKDAQTGRMFATMIGAMVAGIGLYFLLVRVVYKSTPAMLVTVVAFTAAAFAMDWATRRRVSGQTALMPAEG